MASATKDAITLDKLSIKAKKYYDQVAAPRARACGCDAQHWGTQQAAAAGSPSAGRRRRCNLDCDALVGGGWCESPQRLSAT